MISFSFTTDPVIRLDFHTVRKNGKTIITKHRCCSIAYSHAGTEVVSYCVNTHYPLQSEFSCYLLVRATYRAEVFRINAIVSTRNADCHDYVLLRVSIASQAGIHFRCVFLSRPRGRTFESSWNAERSVSECLPLFCKWNGAVPSWRMQIEKNVITNCRNCAIPSFLITRRICRRENGRFRSAPVILNEHFEKSNNSVWTKKEILIVSAANGRLE